jgi:hypothetical protein
MTEIRTGLTYDDVLLVPRRSRVRSRQDVSTRSSFTPGIELEVPRVRAQKSADIEWWQIDLESVGLKFLEIVAANFCRFGGLTD